MFFMLSSAALCVITRLMLFLILSLHVIINLMFLFVFIQCLLCPELIDPQSLCSVIISLFKLNYKASVLFRLDCSLNKNKSCFMFPLSHLTLDHKAGSVPIPSLYT